MSRAAGLDPWGVLAAVRRLERETGEPVPDWRVPDALGIMPHERGYRRALGILDELCQTAPGAARPLLYEVRYAHGMRYSERPRA